MWLSVEPYIRVSFWGLNIGLALMVVTSLFPWGVLQLLDVLRHGYWHARSREFLDAPLVRTFEWLRMPGDLVFISCRVVPLLIATARTYVRTWTDSGRHQAGDASLVGNVVTVHGGKAHPRDWRSLMTAARNSPS